MQNSEFRIVERFTEISLNDFVIVQLYNLHSFALDLRKQVIFNPNKIIKMNEDANQTSDKCYLTYFNKIKPLQSELFSVSHPI